MSDEQARQNARLVSHSLLDLARQLRVKMNDAMADGSLTAAERDEVQDRIDQAADKLEAKAQWWITGDGPAPE